MNQMIEDVAKPVKEVTAVMNEMSVGNMHVAVSGAYEGEFEILSHAVKICQEIAGCHRRDFKSARKYIGGQSGHRHVESFKGDSHKSPNR